MYTRSAGVLALAATVSAYQGFNYASTNGDGSARAASDFEQYFTTAQNLVGTSGFTSARLYTMIQGGTTNSPISALEAAIKTNTTLLLGLWASGDGFENEIAALQNAISTYGSALGPLIAGISVGSEDLYRVSPTGIAADEGPGQNPDTITSYISQVRNTISGTPFSDAPVGHVDTWTAWVNSSNSAVVDACDFVGVDAYPYFQSTMPNPIEDAKDLFDDAMSQVQAAAGSKDVWVTETGWALSGSTYGLAEASVDNAATYWQTVGCSLFGQSNVWWYILDDSGASPSFGVLSDTSSTTPLFNLTCAAAPVAPSPSVSASAVSSAPSSVSSGAGGASGTSSPSVSTTMTTVISPTSSPSSSSSGSSAGSSNQGTSTTMSSTTSTPSSKNAAGTVKTTSAAIALVAFVAAFMAL